MPSLEHLVHVQLRSKSHNYESVARSWSENHRAAWKTRYDPLSMEVSGHVGFPLQVQPCGHRFLAPMRMIKG
ncbi:hypothetical protein BDV35DRAFT_368746 [Aspergillus flavus]|uniref:Uncharacterized protein n=1 Tax=Aspergillus flavus TaxID=5059 RepID=A0A5N6GKX8_ASPFL|nr:hypothetical protein BDV35DRAFT_368746 [Aspergillus flavus]